MSETKDSSSQVLEGFLVVQYRHESHTPKHVDTNSVQ